MIPALAVIRQRFIVTDIEMPDINGLELCRQLRQSSATAKIPIVVVTGGATQAEEATAAGGDVVLRKPCPPAQLLAAIQRLLAEPPGFKTS